MFNFKVAISFPIKKNHKPIIIKYYNVYYIIFYYITN